MRCFVSIDMPKRIMEIIGGIQEKLPDFRGKKTEPENLHLTLKFFGEISEDKVGEVKKRLKDVKLSSFDAEIDSLGVFSEEYVRIVWLHLKGAEELQRQIDLALKGLFPQEKRFMGHLTIARVKDLRDKKRFLENLYGIRFDKIKFRVESFKLKSSVLSASGPKYSTIEEYFLEGK